MRPYPEYKESGVEWLGQVPVGWEVVKLARHSRSGMGQTILREMVTDEPAQGTLPVFSASEGENEFGYLLDPAIRLQKGDLIIGARGSIGMVRYVSEPSTCTQTTIWLKLDREYFDERFLYWTLTGGREALFPYDKTAIPMLTVEQVRSGRVPAPPLAEQRAIAGFLDREVAKIDGLIEESRALIAALAEKRQATISHAVTRGLNPSARLKPSGVDWLGDIPEGWEVVRLKRLATKIGSGKTPSGGSAVYQSSGVMFLRSQNVYDAGLTLDDVAYISDEIDEEMSGTRVNGFDILLNITGASIGRTAMVPNGFEPANVNQHVCIIRMQDTTSAPFISVAMKSRFIKDQILSGLTGAARDGLNFEQIGDLVVAVPTKAEQAEIVDYLDAETARLDALTEEASAAIALLQERRAALISAAVTGKIDTRDTVAAA